MKFILTAVRKSDNYRLHLINRHSQNDPYVICWNYSEKHTSWDWGTYCNDLKEALSVFNQKVVEHRFDEVFEEMPSTDIFEFEQLRSHAGHNIEAVIYGDDRNVSIECVDCCEVLYSVDNPKYEMERND